MEDINNIRTYIQNNYPNIIINGDENCLLITNNKSDDYQDLIEKLNDIPLKEFTLKTRKVFYDVSKIDMFPEYQNLIQQILNNDESYINYIEAEIIEWIWTHDNKTETLIDIQLDKDSFCGGAIFKDQKIMFINGGYGLVVQNDIDKDLVKRTKLFSHIKFFECEGNYDENNHEHCFEIIDYRDSNTEYYDKNNLKIPKFIEEELPDEPVGLDVRPYDEDRGIYREIGHNFLITQTNDEIFCIGKLVDNKILELTDNDIIICDTLAITYRRG